MLPLMTIYPCSASRRNTRFLTLSFPMNLSVLCSSPNRIRLFSLLMVFVNEQEMYMPLVSLGSFRPKRLQILLTVLSVTCAASAISLFECFPNISSTRTHVWKLFLPTVDLTSSISCALRLTVLMLTLSLWERTLSDRIAKFTTSSSSISSVHSILCLGMSVVDDSGVAHEFSADPFTPVMPLLTFISI